MAQAATVSAYSPPPRDLHVQPVLSALKATPFFAGWSPTSLASLALSTSLRSFGPGQAVLSSGQRPDHVLVVVRGRLRSARRADRGREVTLSVLRPGELCVDAFADPSAPVSEWLAAETSLVAFVPRDELAAHLRSNPEATLALVGMLERRLRDAHALVAGLVLDDVETRLHDALVRLARDEGEADPAGTLIRRSPTQQELANRIGACRETVSRIVAELGRQGLLTLRGRRLTLHPAFFARRVQPSAT